MPDRPLRADARRNRERVLQVAAEVFGKEGLAVPVHEIARRAGVGTGTVSRHFPTKEDLFAAILVDRMTALIDEADRLVATADPGTAFFSFFATIVHEGAKHRGLAQALAGAGYDMASAEVDVSGRLAQLLAAAQRAGAVRADVSYADVKALLNGCMTRNGEDGWDGLIAVISQGLRAQG